MPKKSYYDGAIAAGHPGLSCILRKLNNPPGPGKWGSEDDTLDRQLGHGICKGLATAWVIALINGVEEARNPAMFTDYFTNVLRFQGTYIKDYGKHMDAHVTQMIKIGQDPQVELIEIVQKVTLDMGDVPDGNWGAYVSVWKHDVAFGSYDGKYFIMDPNCGLIGFNNKWRFLIGAQSLIEGRRKRKKKGPADKIGLWFYK